MKVSDLTGDFADPRGNSGRSVPIERAEEIAGKIRTILNEDLFEEDIAFNCYCFNNIIDGEEMIAAWEYLNPGERRAWREFVRMGKERDHDRTR